MNEPLRAELPQLDDSLALGKPFGSINEARAQSIMLVEIVSRVLAASLDILQEAALDEIGMLVYLPVNANNRFHLLYPAAGSMRNKCLSRPLLQAFRPRDGSVQVQSFISGQPAFVDEALMLPIFHFNGTSALLVQWSPLDHRIALAPALLRHLRVMLGHSGLLDLLASTTFIHPPEVYRMLLEHPLPKKCVRWVPDAEAPICSLCKAPFGLLFRRHHCRQCLQVVCGNCSAVSRVVLGDAVADIVEAPKISNQHLQLAQQLAQQFARFVRGWTFHKGKGLRLCRVCAAMHSLAAPAPTRPAQDQLRGSAAALCERRKQLIGSKRRLSHETYRLQLEVPTATVEATAAATVEATADATTEPPAPALRSMPRRPLPEPQSSCQSSSEMARHRSVNTLERSQSSESESLSLQIVTDKLRAVTRKVPLEPSGKTKLSAPDTLAGMRSDSMPTIKAAETLPPPLLPSAAAPTSPPLDAVPVRPPLGTPPLAPPPPTPPACAPLRSVSCCRSPLLPRSESNIPGFRRQHSSTDVDIELLNEHEPTDLVMLSQLSLHESIKAKPGLKKTTHRRSTGGTPLKDCASLASGGDSLKHALGQKLLEMCSAAGEQEEDPETPRAITEWE